MAYPDPAGLIRSSGTASRRWWPSATRRRWPHRGLGELREEPRCEVLSHPLRREVQSVAADPHAAGPPGEDLVRAGPCVEVDDGRLVTGRCGAQQSVPGVHALRAVLGPEAAVRALRTPGCTGSSSTTATSR